VAVGPAVADAEGVTAGVAVDVGTGGPGGGPIGVGTKVGGEGGGLEAAARGGGEARSMSTTAPIASSTETAMGKRAPGRTVGSPCLRNR
jgi:hypothetical protein